MHRTTAFLAALSALLALAGPTAAASSEPAEASRPLLAQAPAAPAALPTGFTAEKLGTFSRMVGAPESEVSARLAADARLRETALKAVDAREARRSSGRGRAIAGFVILGVGDIAGAAIMVTAPGYGTPDQDNGRVLLGAGVALASVGVGLALAIPGLVSMGKPGPEERQAVSDYRQAAQPPPPVERPQTGARGVQLTLLSFSF